MRLSLPELKFSVWMMTIIERCRPASQTRPIKPSTAKAFKSTLRINKSSHTPRVTSSEVEQRAALSRCTPPSFVIRCSSAHGDTCIGPEGFRVTVANALWLQLCGTALLCTARCSANVQPSKENHCCCGQFTHRQADQNTSKNELNRIAGCRVLSQEALESLVGQQSRAY